MADIDYTTKDGVRIIMPPLSPPEKCVGKMTMREDDKEETVRRGWTRSRGKVYQSRIGIEREEVERV